MMRRGLIGAFGLATLGILVALLMSLREGTLEEAEQRGHWGPAVAGLSCSIRSNKESYALGEDILLDILLRSETEAPLTVIQPKVRFTYCGDALPLEIEGPRGPREYHGPVLGPPPPYGKDAYKQLVKGEIIGVCFLMFGRHPTRVVPEYWSMDCPGTYTIRLHFVRKNNDYYDHSQQKMVPIRAWEGELLSNVVTIRVVGDETGAAGSDSRE